MSRSASRPWSDRARVSSLVKRIEVNVRDARIEQAVEAFDQPDDLHLELIGTGDGAVNGRVQVGVSPPAVRMPMRFMTTVV